MDKNSKLTLHTGNEIPAMGLGTWQLTDDTTATIKKALDLGYRMIDTSSDYGTQESIGKALKDSGLKRDEYYIVMKVEEDEDAYEATRKNLADIQLDYADLVVIHRPPPLGAGQGLWDGLIHAKNDGLAKDIGVSNYSKDQIQELIDESHVAPVVNQIEWSPFGNSEDMLNYCHEGGIHIQAYSPLTRAKRLDDETLREIAEPYGKTPAQILIRWNLQLGTIPIPKANQLEHLKEDIDVFDFELGIDDMERLTKLNEEYSSLSGLAYV